MQPLCVSTVPLLHEGRLNVTSPLCVSPSLPIVCLGSP